MMRDAINAAKSDPAIINAAVSVVYLMPEKDEFSEARALFHYVQRHIRYVRDVHGLETLASPRLTLARMVGDCDDQTALLGAMLESVGIPTRLVMAAYTSEDFEHVYLQAFAGGEWHSCDPTEHNEFGWEAPGAHKMFIEGA
jgi:transglutaminase-like putative cysteine protease